MSTQSAQVARFISSEDLLQHWQGHRRLTRRVIEAFPEDQLFSYSVGGMRPFGKLVSELLNMAEPTARGVLTGEWQALSESEASTKEEILRRWDESTKQIDALWPQIPPQRFQETMVAFGQYKSVVHALVLYVIDNEVHHRAQGYVYLRALGIEPPAFWERD